MEEARIYVGDYKSYNNGSIKGRWIDLDGLSAEEIEEEISKVLNENTKTLGKLCEEPMIQDFEGFPKEFYSEFGMNYELLVEYLELNENDQEKFNALIDNGDDIVYAMKNYDDVILFGSIEDYIEQCGFWDDLPEKYQGLIDMQRLENQYGYDGYETSNGKFAINN